MMVETPENIDALWQELLPEPAMRAYANENLRMLVLSRGHLKDGTEYYAYLALSPANYIEMLKAERSGQVFTLSDFGEVLQWGEGQEPPQDVKDAMAETYGANPRFATDVAQLLQKAAAGKDSQK